MVRTEDLPALDLWVRRHRFEPDALTGVGQIGGVHVPCMSKAAQAAMHHGYDLPQNHLQDLALLNDHVP